MNIYKSKSKSFTLTELLVVIAVIGLLSSIVLVSMKGAKEKARRAKADADLAQILTAIDIVRHDKDKVLKDVTGSGCSACSCWSADCNYQCQACKDKMDVTFGSLGLPGAILSPWGKYYSVDENELEFPTDPCRKDGVIVPDYKTVQIPFYSTQCFYQ